MEIYMHPRIIVMKAHPKERKQRKKWTSFMHTEIGYGHFEIISLKALVLKRETRETLMLKTLKLLASGCCAGKKGFLLNEIILEIQFWGEM